MKTTHALPLIICLASPLGFAAAADAEPLKVCILSGCPTYNSEASLPPFQEWLEDEFHVRCVRIVRQADDDLPGLEQLDDCDVALIFIKRMELQGEQLVRFQKYVTSGRPIVAVRTASHAVQTWLAFDRQVLGGNYGRHYKAGPTTRVEVLAGAESHPVLDGVSLSHVQDSLYRNRGHADDVQVLLTGSIPGHPAEPLAWTRQYNGGRIFYTSLGAEDTFQEPGFRRLLANALFWTARREVATQAPSQQAATDDGRDTSQNAQVPTP